MSDKIKDFKAKGKGKPGDEKIKISSTDSKDSVIAESTVEKTVAADKNSNASNSISHIEDLLAGNSNSSSKSSVKTDASGTSDTGSRGSNSDTNRKPKKSWKQKKFEKKKASGVTGSNGGDQKNVSSGSKSSGGDALGEVSLRISNRTISEVAQPNAQDLALLGMDNFSSDSIITLREGVIRTERYASAKTGNIGDTIQQESEITDISKIEWTIRPKVPLMVSGGDGAIADAFRTAVARKVELDQPAVNINSTNIEEAEGNNGWPFSSLADSQTIRYPYSPQLIDDIMAISLDGGAIIRQGNTLDPVTDRFNDTQIVIPGATGYNYYGTSSDVKSGRLSPIYKKVSEYRGINHILIGDKMTSARSIWSSATSSSDDNSVISLKGDYLTAIGSTLSKADKIGGNDDMNDFFNYPDLNFETLKHDYKTLYLKHLNMVKNQSQKPEIARLAGFLDEQAFYYSVSSLVHLTTFLWCLRIAFDKAWYASPFVKAKLGEVTLNDMFVRSMPPAGRNGRLQLIIGLPEILKDMPYNKYTVEAFKLWLDKSIADGSIDPFDEQNPLYAIRVVFSGLESIGSPESDSTLSFVSDLAGGKKTKSSYYWPHRAVAKASSALAELDQAPTSYSVDPFGTTVKSLITQVGIFVPHGDWLKNFLQYFGDFIFLGRLTDVFQGYRGALKNPVGLLDPDTSTSVLQDFLTGTENTNKIKGRESLTAIFDPVSFTGFLTSFFSFGSAANEMVRWLTEAKNLAQEWINYLRLLGGNASVCFEPQAVRFDGNFRTYEVEKPTYKQHIISHFRQTTRYSHDINFADLSVEAPSNTFAIVVPHLPNKTLAYSYVSGINPWQAARVGMPIAYSLNNYDFGTKGDVFYDSFTPFARKNDSTISQIFSDITDTTEKSKAERFANGSGIVVSKQALTKPWDLYTIYYYPSMMNIPLYPREGWSIRAGYDYYFTGMEFDSMSSKFSIPTTRGNKSFTWYNIFADTFEELFTVDNITSASGEGSADPVLAFAGTSPTSTCFRFQYGSANRSNIKPHQRVNSIAMGFSASYLLYARINAVSIITANNCNLIGVANTYSQMAEKNNDKLPYVFYTKELERILGIPMNPFLGIKRGGSLHLNTTLVTINFFINKMSSTDLDLSIRFRNLTSVVTKMKSGLGVGEAYPSTSGFGTDLLSHPDKQATENLLGIMDDNKQGGR